MTTFTRLFSSNLYQTFPGTGDIGWCGYIFNGSGTPPESGVSLEDLFPKVSPAFQNGIFVFCPQAPNVTDETSANTFSTAILNCLISQFGTQGSFNYYAMLWLHDATLIESSAMDVITFSYTSFYSVVSPLSYNPSQDVSLAISSSSPCSLDPNGVMFNFFNSNFSNPTLTLNTQFTSNFKNPIQNIYVPTAGPLMGCLVFDVTVPSDNFDFPANNVAINYFYPGQSEVANRFEYPLFNPIQSPSQANYYMSFDPNNQLNHDDLLRTFIVPTGDSGAETILPSAFSTDSGLQVGLSPQKNSLVYPDTTLIWMPQAVTGMFVYINNQQGEGINYDLVPQGQFNMSLWNQPLAVPGTSLNLLCGLSGLETFSFQPATSNYGGDTLNFSAKEAAYASVYVPPSQGSAQSGAAVLNKTYTTSWAAISNGNTIGNTYYSQPTGASLYASGYGVNKTTASLLGFFEPVACVLKSASALIYVPMAPYRLLELNDNADEEDYSDFEIKVLSTNRKSLLEPTIKVMLLQNRQLKLEQNASDGGEKDLSTLVYSTSPQGLLVQVDTTSNQWEQLILASNINVNEASEPVITMEFLDLTPTLQSAFQTNQQFLVMSWNKPVTPNGQDYVLYGVDTNSNNFSNEMVIEGWPFRASLPTSDPNGVFTNVMIYKFCEGTLLDRINDSSKWTSPDVFNSTENGNLELLQSWVTNYCNTAIQKYNNGDANYYQFSTIIQDPNWNGILLLKCDIDVQNFPPELQGLLAGIDLSRFYGHHFGINVNHISTAADGKLSMNPVSSLFGLIDYTDPVFDQYGDNITTYLENVANPPGDYNYKVLSLKVLFANSAIQNFNSYVQLAINNLFGSVVAPVDNSNIIIFTGAYENQNGIPNYTFNETGDNLLALNSNILNGVEIVKANFVTEQPQNQSNATMVTVKFSFWGFLNFSEQDFDLYSFGSPLNSLSKNQLISGDGLSYSNMAIDMSFALETSSVQVFNFDVRQMAFDLGQSNWRSASLYGHFPLQLTGILTGDTTNQPSSQGYIPLPIPGMVGSSTWAGTWYGLVFNLNMGTMGALTNALGFNSTMMMVWTTGASGQMGAMLQLPGLSTQSKTLSLQGVLNLNIGNLQLQSAENQDAEKSMAYMLSMNQITLKFLSFSFPPSGAVNFYLFGDPDANAQPSSLGWYLGYQAKS